MTDNFPRADVKIKVEDDTNFVVTNEKGYFKLENIPYSSNIIFEDESTILKTGKVSEFFQSTCKNIEIEVLNEQLEEIVISNYLTKGVTKQGQKVSILTSDFGTLPGIIEPDVLKSLEHIPSVQSPFETPSRIYVRGSTPDQNLVLWNGIKTYNQSHFFGLISAFNPNAIDEINFYEKGVQSKYGDRLAGVIDIKSSSDVQNDFSGGIGLNLISADAFVKIPIIKDKLSVQGSIRRAYTDLYESPAYEPMAERVFQNSLFNTSAEEISNEFYFIDYSFGLQAAPTSKDQLQFNLLYTKNELDFKSAVAETNNFNDILFTENEGYSLQWQHQYSKKLKQETVLNFSNFTLDYLFENVEIDTNTIINETKKNFVSDYGGSTFFDFNFNPNSKLQVGYQYSNNTIRFEIDNITDNFTLTLDEQRNVLETHSVFSEFEINLKNKGLIQLGVRANDYSTNDELFIEPRLFAEIGLFPNFKINSSFTVTSQAVTQIQESITSNLTLENLLWRITDNDEFSILTSEHVSFGANYKNKGWFIEGDGFYKLTQNITTLTAGFFNPFDNSGFNIGESKTIGGEFFIKKKFKKYATWISYTYTNQESKFDSINNGEYFISNLNIEHIFKWQHFYEIGNFDLSLGWIWNSGRATTNVSSVKEEGVPVQVVFDDLNSENLPVYHKLDVSVLYDFKLNTSSKTKYQVGVSVQNLYDRKSILNREFRTTPGIDNDLVSLEQNSIGFAPNASLRIFW